MCACMSVCLCEYACVSGRISVGLIKCVFVCVCTWEKDGRRAWWLLYQG